MRQMVFTAFDNGITHFDLANNYGPEYGSAEANLGKLLKENFTAYRDELIISTKAGYDMWKGPYGDWGSRKYLLASWIRVYRDWDLITSIFIIIIGWIRIHRWRRPWELWIRR